MSAFNRFGYFWRKLTALSPVYLACLLALSMSGCKTLQFGKAGVVPEIIHAQTPGTASGAGGTITGPANSGAPTTQVSERRAAYFPPFPGPVASVRVNTPTANPMTLPPKETALASIPAPSQPEPQVAAIWERTETTIGAHQSATGIVKAAATMEGWSTFRWLSLLALVVGLGGMLYSYNNEASGYMMVWMKVAGVGAFCLLTSDNPFWLLLLLIPAAFYAAQRFNLFRIL